MKIGFCVGERTGVDLTVTANDGSLVSVCVDAGEGVEHPPGCLIVKGPQLTGRKIADALEVFDILQLELGYEPKAPVSRGEIPANKLSYEDHFEEVALRHTELRRAPNPTTLELRRFEPVMKKATWSFTKLNYQLLQDHMLEFDELFGTYARAWTINYLAWYAVPEHLVTDSNNEKKLYVYLWQRFSELRSLLQKKGRNVLATLDVASIGQHGETYDYSDKAAWGATSAEEFEGEADLPDAPVARAASPQSRRIAAAKKLEVHLSKLDHDSMVKLLQDAAENDRIHPDAQRLAAQKLVAHVSQCTCCATLEYSGLTVEVDEESAGLDSGGAQE